MFKESIYKDGFRELLNKSKIHKSYDNTSVCDLITTNRYYSICEGFKNRIHHYKPTIFVNANMQITSTRLELSTGFILSSNTEPEYSVKTLSDVDDGDIQYYISDNDHKLFVLNKFTHFKDYKGSIINRYRFILHLDELGDFTYDKKCNALTIMSKTQIYKSI